jgi:cytochrome oxidase assembly protein ShyY1
MRRLPPIATLIVIAAVATMIGLGFWQLRRAEWKEAMLARYAAAPALPTMALPAVPDARDPPLFRRASALCLSVASWRAVAGRDREGEPGWVHVAECRTGAEGPGFAADMGWSKSAANPAWRGGEVTGIVAPDRTRVYRLVATRAAPGLAPSAPPTLDLIVNNHRAYAVQWFAFAAIAGLVFALALRWRQT